MTCEEALVLISGHIDGENTPEEEAQLRLHLEHCEECRAVLAAYQEMESGVAALEEEPPAELREQVMAAIRAEKPVRKKRPTRWVSLAAAAALVLVIGAASLPMLQPEKEHAAPMAATRSMPAEAASTSGVYTADSAVMALDDTEYQIDPQQLAEERQADVAVTQELLPEMEVCPCETVEGGLLYCLDSRDSAVELSRAYGLALYTPSAYEEAAVSYALLLPQH